MTVPISVSVNGRSHEREVPPRLLLVHFLRDELDLTGTHVGCETSLCGACTVLVDGRAVKSCTMLAAQADGSRITTIEGLADGDGAGVGAGDEASGRGAGGDGAEAAVGGGSAGGGLGGGEIDDPGALHPLQRAFWEDHGLQCGFCTPGMILSAHELLRENPDPDEEEIREGLEGNLCRCTGYHNIVRAVRSAAAEIRGEA